MAASPSSKIILEGYLEKKSPKAILGVHMWQTRYIVLYSDRLAYFKEEEHKNDENQALGIVATEHMDKVMLLKEKSDKRFNVVLTGADRKFEFLASDGALATRWVKAFTTVLIPLEKRTSGTSVMLQAGIVGEEAKKFWKGATQKKLRARRQAIGIQKAIVRDTKHDVKNEDTQDQKAATMKMLMNAILRYPIFDVFRPVELQELLSGMWQSKYKKGEIVVEQGERVDTLFLIEKGTAKLISEDEGEKSMAIKKEGELFCETAFLHNISSPDTVYAETDLLLWVGDGTTIKDLIHKAQAIRFDANVKFLKATKLMGQITDSQIKKAAEALDSRKYNDKEMIIRQGEEGDMFYLLKSGRAQVLKDGKAVLLYEREGDYFGERALLKNEVRAASVQAVGPVEVMTLSRKDFNMLLGNLQELLDRGLKSYGSDGDEKKDPKIHYDKGLEPSAQGAAAEPAKNKPEPRCPVRNLSEIRVIGTLGRGTFGNVKLVTYSRNSVAYALKAVSKQRIVVNKQITHILNERAVMMEIDHTFCVKLFGTFRDKDQIYFFLEPSLGGELFSLLRDHDKFDEKVAMFYAANVALVFEYLHSKDILYRDLKPENLLIDHQGYIKVTDFGFAKKTADRTYTFCGTPDYLAPEIITNVGHHVGADWWTLGIFIYEMIAGHTPFFDERGPTRMYTKILSGKIAFPPFFSPALRDLLLKLLTVKPARRLGVILGGATLIKDHAWFKGFSFQDLIDRKVKAPYTLPVKDMFDLSNFDSYPEEDPIEPHNPPPGVDKNWDAAFEMKA